jgi:hypothetical protein
MADRPRRPTFRPTPAILAWAAADVVGVLMLAVGAAYLVQGAGFLGLRFPSSTIEAAITTILGLGLIVVAAVKMLAEVLRHMPQDSAAARRN